mmetsp:Transcript_9951/g.29840  ORF Transcript_9951/g.29840 Transcript_9951/m.29840 type:complete len:220 (-) Transcript_9951:7-666(-)
MLDPMHNTALLMYFVRAAHHEARRPRPRCARDSLSPSALIRSRMAHGSVLGSWLGATGSSTRSESVASKEEWARLAAGHRSSEAYELASSLSSEKVMRRSTRAGSCNSSERRLLCRSVGSAEELGSAELRLEQRGGSTGASAIERRRASTASRDPGAEAGGAGGGGGGEADRPSAEGASTDTRSPGDGARAGTGLAAGGSGEGGGGCGTEAESMVLGGL